jgi:hypothetical protein
MPDRLGLLSQAAGAELRQLFGNCGFDAVDRPQRRRLRTVRGLFSRAGKFRGESYVEGKMVAEATMTFALVDKAQG